MFCRAAAHRAAIRFSRFCRAAFQAYNSDLWKKMGLAMQRTSRMILAAFAAVAVGTGALAASVSVPQDTISCKLEGWSTDKDPKGLNVRAAPDASAPILAKLLPRPQAESGSLAQFEILGFKDGWVLIKGASYGDYGDPPPATPLYSGMGWVHGSRVGGQLVGGQNVVGLYSEPKDTAKRLPRPANVDEIAVNALLGCTGSWAKVDTNIGVGWVYGLCANQVTTCN
jgi:hypothetical protein